ncbi:MAG TPA: hypothetical protein VGD99_00035 [Anaerolineae bacterium]
MTNRDNPHIGSRFEQQAQRFFSQSGLQLERNFPIDVGVTDMKKPHKFDLGSEVPPVLVECKAHTWTEGGNSPSAKLSVWNEAMYYFAAAPTHFRKILFVLKGVRGNKTLAQYYIGRYEHLIPAGVEIWEFDREREEAECIYGVKM